MGLKLSEEVGNLTKYVATHEDKARGLYFHPVLLEKMAKSKEYKLPRYVDELDSICGRSTQMEVRMAHSQLCHAPYHCQCRTPSFTDRIRCQHLPLAC